MKKTTQTQTPITTTKIFREDATFVAQEHKELETAKHTIRRLFKELRQRRRS